MNDDAKLILRNRIHEDFRYSGHVNAQARELALEMVQDAPLGRHLSVALTKLEESMMWYQRALEVDNSV